MHSASKREMAKNILKYCCTSFISEFSVLDVGSLDVNGSYRKLMPEKWEYIGVDIVAGKNVDEVMASEYDIPFSNCRFDIAISGQCLEHCRNPFVLMKEIARVVKGGGYIIVTAPCEYPFHGMVTDQVDLKDYWRFYPDGFNELFEQAELETIETYIVEGKKRKSTWGIAQKKRS